MRGEIIMGIESLVFSFLATEALAKRGVLTGPPGPKGDTGFPAVLPAIVKLSWDPLLPVPLTKLMEVLGDLQVTFSEDLHPSVVEKFRDVLVSVRFTSDDGLTYSLKGHCPFAKTSLTNVLVWKVDATWLQSKSWGQKLIAQEGGVLVVEIDCDCLRSAGQLAIAGGAGRFHWGNDGGVKSVAPGGIFRTWIKASKPKDHVWSRVLSPVDGTAQSAVAVDPFGNLFVGGHFHGTLIVPGNNTLSAAGHDNAFLVKLNAYGDCLWSKQIGETSAARTIALQADIEGNVYLAGRFSGSISFGGPTLLCNGNYDVFVAKLGPNGEHLWSKCFGGTGVDEAVSLAVDAAGNVVVVGAFNGTVDFGDGPKASHSPSNDLFIVKLDSKGSFKWVKTLGDVGDDRGRCVAIDLKGGIVVAGHFDAWIHLGGVFMHSKGSDDIFVLRLTAAGDYHWGKQFGGVTADRGLCVATDAQGDVILTGHFTSATSFGGPELQPAAPGIDDIFVAKLSSSGEHLWSFAFGDEQEQRATGLAVDWEGNIFVTGYFYGTMKLSNTDWLATDKSKPEKPEVFVAKLHSDGTVVWGHQIRGALRKDAYSVAVADAVGNVVLSGVFEGETNLGGGTIASVGVADIFVVKLSP